MAINLPQPVKAIIDNLRTGDRHMVEDADEIHALEGLDIACHHRYNGYEVIVRYSIQTAWHDGNGAHQEFEFLELETE